MSQNLQPQPGIKIATITALPAGLDALAAEARSDGFRFLDRLIADWQDATNRFDAPGEALFAAYAEESLVGICGLNTDPYLPGARIGRLRRLYVARNARRLGTGTTLVEHVIGYAAPHFDLIRLTTDTAAGARFYDRLGFARSKDPNATHQKLSKSFR